MLGEKLGSALRKIKGGEDVPIFEKKKLANDIKDAIKARNLKRLIKGSLAEEDQKLVNDILSYVNYSYRDKYITDGGLLVNSAINSTSINDVLISVQNLEQIESSIDIQDCVRSTVFVIM